MSARVIGRKEMLRGAGAVAGGAAVAGLAVASPVLARDNRGDGGDDLGHRHGLTGSWLITRQDDGDPEVVQAVISFAGGGVFLSEDINPSAPVFLGTWASADGLQFRATFWTGSVDPNAGGPITVVAVGQRGNDMINGKYTFTAFDANGSPVFEGTGTLKGTRIVA